MKKIIALFTLSFVVSSSLSAGMIAVPVKQTVPSQQVKTISSLYQQVDAAGFLTLTPKKNTGVNRQETFFCTKDITENTAEASEASTAKRQNG